MKLHGRSIAPLMSSAALVFGATVAVPAFAQASPASVGDSQPGDIIVTARKKSETAQDVPISLTVVSGDAIAAHGIAQLEDLAQFAPDMQQSNGASGTFRTMRGGGSIGSNFSFEQSTGLFFDEVSYGRNEQARIPIFDVERVEVLRGPQVIAFGNSTTSGAISVTTKKPGKDFSADLTGSYEFNADQFVARGGVTLPMANNVSVRIAGFTDQMSKGWLKVIAPPGYPDSAQRNNINAGRITLVAEPIDAMKVTLKYEHSDVRITGTNLEPITNANPWPFVTITDFGPVTAKGSPAPFDRPDKIRMTQNIGQATVDYDLGGVQLTSITAYWHYDFKQAVDGDSTPAAVAFFQPQDNFEQFSQELRLGGKIGGAVSYLTGVYYQHDNQFAQAIFSGNRAALGIANPPPAFARVAGVDQHANTLSAFLNLSVKVASTITIEPGVRYTHIRRHGNQFAYGSDIFSDVPSNAYDAYLGSVFGVTTHNYRLSAPESHWMPQLVVSYKPNRDLHFFAKVIKGAKTGGIDWAYVGNDPSQALFGAEKVTDYEAGVKAEVLDRRLSLGLTFFHSKYKDLQLSIFESPRFVTTNAGGQRSQGIEAEYNWRIAPGLTMSGSVSYLDAKYTDFRNAGCTLEQAFTLPAPCTQDLTGKRSGFSSKWYGTGQITYVRPIGGYELLLQAETNYRSRYSPTTNDDPVGNQDPVTIVNGRIQLKPANGPWTLALFGRNLLNEYYSNFVSGNGASLTRGVTPASFERTRQIGVEFGVKF